MHTGETGTVILNLPEDQKVWEFWALQEPNRIFLRTQTSYYIYDLNQHTVLSVPQSKYHIENITDNRKMNIIKSNYTDKNQILDVPAILLVDKYSIAMDVQILNY